MSSTFNPLHRLFRIDAAHHGDLSQTHFDSTANLEVMSIGLSRTGTTSLHEALTILGFGPCHQGIDLFRSPALLEQWIALYSNVLSGRWHAGDPALNDELHRAMRRYRSVTDMPVCPLPEEVYAEYPRAKFILTVRPSGGTAWFQSMQVLMWHFRCDGWRMLFRTCISSVRFIRRSDDVVQLIRELWVRRYGSIGPHIYDAHNEDVKKLVSKDDLLVFDLREGWEPSCRFLNVEVPDKPFPNLSDAESMAAIYTGMMLFGACAGAAYLAGLSGLAYLAFKPSVAGALLGRIIDLRGNWRGTES